MQYLVFEDFSHIDLRPFTFTRPVYELRAGIFTNRERWEKVLKEPVKGVAQPFLAKVWNAPILSGESIWINGKCIPDDFLIAAIQEIAPESFVIAGEEILLVRSSINWNSKAGTNQGNLLEESGLTKITIDWKGNAIRQLPNLFQLNAQLIAFDFELAISDRKSAPITDPFTKVYGKDNLFVSEGVEMRGNLINAEDGPIYIGPNVRFGEGAIIARSHAFGTNAKVSMGAKLRGDSSFGPHVKVGGEVGNSVIMGYSNKSHDGYLGNSVIGHWCNLGADTNTSNLKSNYGEVKLWNYATGQYEPTGSQHCGLMMGDHSKTSINTMFNTGTVVGVSANIFGAGFPAKFIPSFSWGGHEAQSTYQLRKAIEVAKHVLSRRGKALSEKDEALLETIFKETATYRFWEDK